MDLRRRKSITPYLLLAPAVLLFFMWSYFPFFKTIYLSFFLTNTVGDPVKFVGIKNYTRLLNSSQIQKCIMNTLRFAGLVGVGSFFVSITLALLSTRKSKGSRLYEVCFALPMAVASAPVSIIWFYILTPGSGILNHLLGTSARWLSDPQIAIYSVAVVTIWSNIGMSFIFLMTGFRNVPEDLLESADIDGANFIRKIFNIILPVASPTIFFVVFLNIISSFKAFAMIYLLTDGGPANSTNTLIYSLYNMAFRDSRFESAAVLSLVLFIIIFVVTRIQFFFERKVNYS